MSPRQLQVFHCPVVIPVLLAVLLLCQGGALAAPAAPMQQILLSPLDADSPVDKGGWKLGSLTAAPAEVTPKVGQCALRLGGVAEQAGAKGDFALARSVPGQCRSLSLWVYLEPAPDVASVGLQITDAEGEAFLLTVPADWTGWKEITLDLSGAAPPQAYAQPDKNKRVDFPLASVHAAWFAKAAGPTAIVVDALTAATALTETPSSLSVQVSGADWAETGMPLAPQTVVLTNFAAQARAAKIEYVIQRDPAFYSTPAPDPDYGADVALGAKSWTEAEGKIIERGSLTDGKDWTHATLGWGSHKEAVQYVDLGRACTVTHLAYQSGDANWAWKMEISASGDGQTYQPVPGLADMDTHGKWGRQEISVPQPFRARFLRLRHHNGGQVVSQIAMPSSLFVYAGLAGDWQFPTVGETVARGTLSQTVPAQAFSDASITEKEPLGPGAYLMALRVTDGSRTQLIYRHLLVMPAPLASVAGSRFGVNASNYLWAGQNRRLGVGWARFENLKWPMVSPQPDVFNFHGVAPWSLDHDAIFQAYHDAGLHILPFLFQSPDYATSAPATIQKNRDDYPPRDNAQMADFVFQTVARYGSQKHRAAELKTSDKKTGLSEINTYEIWNESNLHDPGWGAWVGTTAQYNSMFRAAAEAVKRADPTARVTNSGFAGIDIETMNTLLTPYADGKKPLDFVDTLNVHYYSGQIAPEIATVNSNTDRSGNTEGVRTYGDDLRRLIAWRDKNKPGMPIWMSETGYNSAGPTGVNEQYQAAYLPRAIMLALAAGIDKVFVYRESGSTPSLFAASGVMRDDGSLKPAWFTYATLIREMDGIKTGAMRLPYPDPNVRLYAWTRGTETFLSAWAIDGTAELKLPLGVCQVTDAFGHTRQVTVTDSLPLSIFPVYIQHIANPAALNALTAQARQSEATRRQEQARLAKLKAYLFQFGSKDRVGTIDFGETRSFTPLLGSDVYDAGKGYGFFPGPGGQDSIAGWVDDPLERGATRMNPGNSFRFHPAPGRYRLRVSLSPQGPGQLVLKGALGGDQTFPITQGGPVVTAEVEVGPDPLSLSNTAYGDLHWLTLVEDLHK